MFHIEIGLRSTTWLIPLVLLCYRVLGWNIFQLSQYMKGTARAPTYYFYCLSSLHFLTNGPDSRTTKNSFLEDMGTG